MKDKGETVKKTVAKRPVARTVARSSKSSEESGRARAWLFLLVSSAQEVVDTLREERRFERGGDEYVIVRADIVKRSKDFPFNIVIPLDTESEEVLKEQVERIVKRADATKHAVAEVRTHIPFPPHDSHGFITEEEYEQSPDDFDGPGRQGASPGRNPWG